MISGLHSHSPVGRDPLAFCALKQKKKVHCEQNSDGRALFVTPKRSDSERRKETGKFLASVLIPH